MSDKNNNCRLEINPLIEENMNQMEDSEFSVSQLTGHITFKREEKYISKTKELYESSEYLKIFYDDSKNRKDSIYTEELLNSIKSSINSLESNLSKSKKLIEDMENKLEEYENISKELETELNRIDFLINSDLIYSMTDEYNNSINNALRMLGDLLIKYEWLKIPEKVLSKITSYINTDFNYYDSNKNSSNNYKIDNESLKNIYKNIENRIKNTVDKKEFDEYATSVIQTITNLVYSIPTTDKKKIKGSFTISADDMSFTTGNIKNY